MEASSTSLTPEQLEALAEKGQIIPRTILKKVARLDHKGSSSKAALKAVKAYEKKGFEPVVIYDGVAFVVFAGSQGGDNVE